MITVIYVDDEPDLLEIGRMFLERDGEFSVTTVASAGKALETLKNTSFDAIISDYQMPEMNGIDLLKKVRASGNTIPFIIFTGRGREEIVIAALNEGADFYIQKGGEPVSQFADLAHKTRKAVLQRKAEAKIRNQERREADIINFLPDATVAIDSDGIVIAWNRAMEAMSGVKAADILGKGDHEYTLPFYHRRCPVLIDLVLKDDKTIAERYSYIKKAGDTIFSEITIPEFNNGRDAVLWATASPLYDTQGRVAGAIESVRDITEWKKTEEALRFTNTMLSTQLESSPDGILVVDEAGRMISFNRRFVGLWGISPEVAASRSDERALQSVLGKLIDPDEFLTRVRYLYAHKDETSREEIDLRDGRTFEWYSVPMVGDDGKYYGRIWNFRDLTARKKAEESLQQSEVRFRSLIQNASDMILILGQDGKIKFESPSAADILGYPPGECLGKDPLTLVHPDDLEHVRAALLKVYDRTNSGTPTEFRARRADGTCLWVDTVATNLLNVPAVNGIVLTTRLIEKRKKLENAIRESEEKYRTLVENSQDGVFIVQDSRMVFYNKAFAVMTGYNEQELVDHHISDILAPEDAETVVSRNEARMRGEPVPVSYEFAFLHKDKTTRIRVRMHAGTAIYRGRPATIGTFRNITDDEKREEALRTSRERLELALWGADEGIVDVDLVKNTVETDRNTRGMLGYGPEEFPTTLPGFLDLIHPEDRPEGDRQFADLLAGRIPSFGNEQRMRTASGEWRWILTRGKIVDRDGSGKPLRYIGTHRDISDRRRAEETLITMSREYNDLLDNLQDVFYRTDTDGRLTRISRSLKDLLGYDDVSELLGKNIADCFYLNPEDRKSALDKIHREGKVTNYEVRLKRKDGTPIWISASSHILHDHDGTLCDIEGTFRDISGQKRMEEAIKESEEKYRSLSEASPDLIFVIDPDDRVTYVNNSAATMLGYAPAEIAGRKRSDLFPPEIADLQGRAIRKVFETGESQHSTGKLGFSGREFWYDHALMPVRDGSGRVSAVLGISRDITELKHVEEALRQRTEELDSRNRLISTMLDTIPIGIFMVEAPSGKPLIANHEAERLLGRGILPNATGANLAEVYAAYKAGTSEHYPADEMPVIRGMYGESRHIDDMVVVRPDGTAILLEVFGTPVTDRGGRVTASLVCFLDITERKKAERTILATNQKMNLLSGITRHDVANQVSILRGFAQIARMKNQDPAITEVLGKIDAAGSAIARQIAFTKEYQDLGMHAPAWYRVSELVAKVKPAGIKVACTCDAEVYADPMLEKVFFNLFENAVRHGGHVTEIAVSCEQGERGLVIAVEDNGIGVPQDEKERIFEKGVGKNTGYGLFLAKEILSITGITIRETGVPGRGARFEITVPDDAYRIR